MKVLQLYYKMPFPMHDGGSYSIYSASLSLISQDIDLTILAMNMMKAPASEDLIPQDFKLNTRFKSVVVDNRVKPLSALISLIGNKSYFAGRFISKDFSKSLIALLHENEFDMVQLEHLYLCQYIDVVRKYSNARIVLRAQNVEHKIWQHYAAKLTNPFLKWYFTIESNKLKEIEDIACCLVDGIISLTKEDGAYFKSVRFKTSATLGAMHKYNLKVRAIPIGIIPNGSAGQSPGNQDGLPLVYHLGSMDWRPNVEGIRWFIKEVLPLIVEKMPDIRVHIAGRNMPSWFFGQRSKNLIVDTNVTDSAEYQRDKAIMVVPLLSGSGIRVKILEGMALGKTIIATSLAATGIVNKEHDNVSGDEQPVIIADSPHEFAEQVCKYAKSAVLCREIGDRAFKLASEEYNINNIGVSIVSFYKQLAD